MQFYIFMRILFYYSNFNIYKNLKEKVEYKLGVFMETLKLESIFGLWVTLKLLNASGIFVRFLKFNIGEVQFNVLNWNVILLRLSVFGWIYPQSAYWVSIGKFIFNIKSLHSLFDIFIIKPTKSKLMHVFFSNALIFFYSIV
jgi:hypothetical protein